MKDLVWCPIDIPKLPVIPKHTNGKQWNCWNMMRMTERKETPYEVSDWTEEVKTLYPNLVTWFNYFPYKTIRNIKLNIQTEAVGAHIDFTKPELNMDLYKNNIENEPCGYRIIVRGNRKNTLYVVLNNKKVYCNMPEETDVYVLGHATTLHGVEEDPDRITIFTHFEIDSERHKLLLERSIEKYKEYAVFGSVA